MGHEIANIQLFLLYKKLYRGETVLSTEGGKSPTNTTHQKISEIPFDAARAGLKVTSHLIGCDASSLLHVVPSLSV